jgi:hypothetical protein
MLGKSMAYTAPAGARHVMLFGAGKLALSRCSSWSYQSLHSNCSSKPMHLPISVFDPVWSMAGPSDHRPVSRDEIVRLIRP